MLHVHGFWRQPDTVVLDVGDYENVIGDPLTQAGLRTLGEAWSLLFVGCGEGLADPHFEQFLDWMGTVLKGARHRHFRLERHADVSRRQTWHNDRGHRIRVIGYGDEFAALPAFVARLRAAAASGDTADSSFGLPPVATNTRPSLSAGEYVRLQEKGRSAVTQLIALADKLGWESIAAHGAELSATLEQDLYRVAITGKSRAGKSTLMNALVGRDICPVQRVITTAIPIIIGPAEVESATVTFEGKKRSPLHLDGPITTDMLAPYADQRHNPDNVKRVERIDVRLGHQVLDLGVEYIDIPGFDDPSGRIWSATKEVIEQAHALALVLDVSTYADGGFALDRATRELLEAARRRGCPTLVVCNKADKLSATDRTGASKVLADELKRLGLADVLSLPAFFVSARDATEARARGEALPVPFATFEEALWQQLWLTESVGLRRLHKVFDSLRVADEEVTALIRVRYAKGPERDLLREAVAQCREDEGKHRGTAARDTENLHALAAEQIDGVRAEHLRAIAQYVAALPAGQTLPAISVAIEALQEPLAVRCRSVVSAVEPEAITRSERIDKAVARSLSKLREQVGLSAQAQQIRDAVDVLSDWAADVSVPDSGADARKVKVGLAGMGTAAAIGFAIGGPGGWVLGGVLGFLASVFVDHVTDTVKTREELRAAIEKHARNAFATFSTNVENAIASAGSKLDARIRRRMQPFLRDMQGRLEAIREPTDEEHALHEQMHRTTADALNLLVGLLGNRHPQRAVPPPSEAA